VTEGEAAPAAAEAGSRNLVMRVIAALVLAPLAIAIAYVGGLLWTALATLVAIGLYMEWLTIVGGADAIRVVASGIVALALAGFAALIFVLLIVWVTDIGGYFAGRGIGGPRLWPRVSPKKTWAGAVGGFVASLAVAAGFAAAGVGKTVPLLMLSALLTVVSQLGDLFESAVKRRFGVKDSSHIIPGHGGLLDRLDGFVAAVVVAAIFGFLRGGADGVGRGLMVW
jgi:phosphatidate cytidylyltransferase